MRFSVVALMTRSHDFQLVGDKADVILDVDLDAYGTTSPGALALRSAGLDPVTPRLYRLALQASCTYDFLNPTSHQTVKRSPGPGPVTRRKVADELRDVGTAPKRAFINHGRMPEEAPSPPY